MTRPVNKIAAEIDTIFSREKAKTNPNWLRHVRPYVEAMLTMTSFKDMYGLDPGDEIGRRFLVNAQPWRGEDARRIKAEIKEAMKEAYASHSR
jgi:hypothetical protein